MFPIINHISSRGFKIRNFEEDKIATLNANRGLRYEGIFKNIHLFCGNYYLINSNEKLIEAFQIEIFIGIDYPNDFPVVKLMDNKVERIEDNHISKEGIICFDHPYIINVIKKGGLRIYDFVKYYLPKYFSWVLIKKYGDSRNLQEWAHDTVGTKQFYECLLDTNDKIKIRLFLENYCKALKLNRNDKCYCGSDKKIKHCHIEAAKYLNDTTRQIILNDIILFE